MEVDRNRRWVVMPNMNDDSYGACVVVPNRRFNPKLAAALLAPVALVLALAALGAALGTF